MSLACSAAGSLFRQGTFITRSCSETGVWGNVDLSTCTLVSSSPPFILVSFILETDGESPNVDDIDRSQLEAAVITELHDDIEHVS